MLATIVLLFIYLFFLAIGYITVERLKVANYAMVTDDEPLHEYPDRAAASERLVEYREDFNVENQVDCNARTLHKCVVGEIVFGCKELTAQCHHFDRDTKLFVDGEEFVVPRNENPKDGYALVLLSAVDQCNPYHGDFVLVKASQFDNEYALICLCKNPGLIGNIEVTGACNVVFMCRGKIKNNDINKPLHEIDCECAPTELSVRLENDVPVCRVLTVAEANKRYDDWTNLVTFRPDVYLTNDLSTFHTKIRTNVNVSKLIDHCRNAVDDLGIHNEEAQPYEGIYCQTRGWGVPVPYGVAADEDGKLGRYAALLSGKLVNARFTANVGRRVVNSTVTARNLNFDNDGYPVDFLVPNARLGNYSTIAPTYVNKDQVYYLKIDGNDFGYDASIGKLYFLSADVIDGIPYSSFGFNCPYPWSCGCWEDTKKMKEDYLKPSEEDGTKGATMRQEILMETSNKLPICSMQYNLDQNSYNEHEATQALMFLNENDFKTHLKNLV